MYHILNFYIIVFMVVLTEREKTDMTDTDVVVG
jgi:hypothetical protein